MKDKNNKNNKKVSETKANKEKGQTTERIWRGIMGAGRLLVMASISYSTYIVLMYVDDPFTKLAVIPQALLVAWMLVDHFIIKRSK